MRLSQYTLICVLLLAARPASAQRLLDLQVRTSAAADALTSGAAAVFWNPAGAGALERRAEALIVDVRGSAASGVGGLALAGAFRLDPRTSLAAGIQSVGIDGIGQTSTSPIRDPNTGDLDIGEHVFGAALARDLTGPLTVGATLRYARTADVAGGEGAIEWGGGVIYRSALPWRPVLGAAVRAERGGTQWTAGVDIEPPLRSADWQVRVSLGASGSPQVHGLTHRIAGIVSWQDHVTVSAGLAGEPGGEGRSWQPLAAATLSVSRYRIGVVREQLPNDFGAIHSLRFSVAFD